MDRPIPIPCDLDRPFWDGAREGKLLLQRSRSGGRFQAYPRGHALDNPMAGDNALDWVEVGGRGTVQTFSTVHRSFYPAIAAPYVFAVIRLDEGVQMTGHIIGIAPDAVRIGMRVLVTFVPLNDAIALPCFRPEVEAGT